MPHLARFFEGLLRHAAKNGLSGTVALICNQHINPNGADSHGWTPVLLAISGGHQDTAKFLLRHGGDLRHVDTLGGATLRLTVLINNMKGIDLLLDNRVDIN